MPNVEYTCEVCRRSFVRRNQYVPKPPRFCSFTCRGLTLRKPGNYLERRREIMLRSKAKQKDPRVCTCHPDDNPPRPCPQRFAYSECVAATKQKAAS